MNAIRKLLNSRNGFTLVELMVVVVVLGILAGIAVQRMGDVRDRAETAAREANTRLLLGAANLALVRNYGDFMYSAPQNNPTVWRNAVIRWLRPCEGPAVTQMLSQGHPSGGGFAYTFSTGYGHIDPWPNGNATWTSGQEWNLTDYLESFPVGYAVEIIFAARDDSTGEIKDGENYGINTQGFHSGSYSTPADYSAYNKDQVIIYKYNGNVTNNSWVGFNSYLPGGNTGVLIWGTNYPYYYTGGSELETFRSSWVEVFPVDRYSN